MNGRENFLHRWSRRKRENSLADEARAREAARADAALPGTRHSQENAQEEKLKEPAPVTSAPASAGATDEVPFDLTKLPPLETITAQTDIRGYLAAGVPAELTRAALRRAWATDPQIRDFVGLSENAWDFNAPEGVAGFGPLELTDEMRRRISSMVGRSLQAEPTKLENPEPLKPETAAPAKTPEAAENSKETAENICTGISDAIAAPENDEQAEAAARSKAHGGRIADLPRIPRD
jgi:hypothetical protein